VTLLVHLGYRAPPVAVVPHRWRAFASTLGAAVAQRRTWVVLACAATSAAAFEIVGAMAGSLLVDRGYGDESIGRFFTVAPLVGLGLGALAGGPLSDRFGRTRVVVLAGLGLAVVTAALALSSVPTWLGLGTVYLAAGCFTASTYALFMDHTDPRLGSTQFSAYMGATNLCESWSARLGGRVVSARGYESAFLGGAAVTLVSLLLLLFLRTGTREERRAGGTC
jgi:MFS family permease